MANILEFLRIAYDYMNEMTIPLGDYTFSFMDILKTEVELIIAFDIVALLWHFGINFDWNYFASGKD